MRVGVGLRPHKPMQGAAIVEMVLDESWRHPLCTNDRGTQRGMIVRDRGDTDGHLLAIPLCLSAPDPRRSIVFVRPLDRVSIFKPVKHVDQRHWSHVAVHSNELLDQADALL